MLAVTKIKKRSMFHLCMVDKAKMTKVFNQVTGEKTGIRLIFYKMIELTQLSPCFILQFD